MVEHGEKLLKGQTEEEGSSSRLIFSERRFDEFPISDLLKEALAEMKYDIYRQEEVIEAALQGKDLVRLNWQRQNAGFGLFLSDTSLDVVSPASHGSHTDPRIGIRLVFAGWGKERQKIFACTAACRFLVVFSSRASIF